MLADGSGLRDPGGIFMKLTKAARSSESERHYAATAAAAAAAAAAAPAVFQLRRYQQAAIDRITAGGGNWVVCAPTNAGKTAVFIELSK
ncbi:hypothetical protein FOA52_005882 [Chlamydomonas sp. UWO 241]|nr:hypothetical protein FOA52_005882 [Chlamydomonas sp. UWO 241]